MASIESAVKETIMKINKNYVVKKQQLEGITNIVNKKYILWEKPHIPNVASSVQFTWKYWISYSNCCVTTEKLDRKIKYQLLQDLVKLLAYTHALCLYPCSLQNVSAEDLSFKRYNLIIDTPEAWLNDTRWRNILSSNFFRKNVVCIAVDEAHKVVWGVPSPETKETFREAFSRINTLRSFCGEHVPILALSATVDQDLTHLISSCCGLSSRVKTIHSASNCENIRLSVVSIKSKDFNCFNWLCKQIQDNCENCPKVLIYCQTQTLVGWLFEKFLLNLKDLTYKNSTKKREILMIDMYHLCTLESNKKKVSDALTGQESENTCSWLWNQCKKFEVCFSFWSSLLPNRLLSTDRTSWEGWTGRVPCHTLLLLSR